MRRFLIGLCLCFGMFLVGCMPIATAYDPIPPRVPSEPVLISESQDAGAGDRSQSFTSTPPPFEGWPWDDLPLRLGMITPPDSGVDQTPSDASVVTTGGDETPRAWMQPTGRTLAANTCNDRALRLSPEVTNWARQGYQLWHLCYRTPTRATSSHLLAARRSSSVTLVYLDDNGRVLRDIMAVPAPHLANPWTINVLLVFPPGTRPFLNLENHYSSSEHLYALQAVYWNEEIVVHGELHAWRVAPNGVQTRSPPGVACLHVSHVTGVEGREYFFVPSLACPGGFESCRLGAYDCRDLIPVPL